MSSSTNRPTMTYTYEELVYIQQKVNFPNFVLSFAGIGDGADFQRFFLLFALRVPMGPKGRNLSNRSSKQGRVVSMLLSLQKNGTSGCFYELHQKIGIGCTTVSRIWWHMCESCEQALLNSPEMNFGV